VVRPEVHEPGTFLVLVDKLKRLVDEELCAIPTLHLVFVRPDPIGGSDVGIRLRTLISPYTKIIAIGREFRRVSHVATTAQMPLADMRRCVAGRLEHPR